MKRSPTNKQKCNTADFDARYPRISFRLPPQYKERMKTLKRETGLSFGAIVQNCITHTLPSLEERHGVR